MIEVPPPAVLIVDDDRVNRSLLASLLENHCRVLLAKDGASALQKAQQEDLALILLDVSMPGLDGYEVLRRLRADPHTAETAVIFITGKTSEEDEERGLLLGATDYVTKPIRPAIVRARIQHHLKLVMQRRELEHLSQRDGLTQIYNRRHLDNSLELACRNAARANLPFGIGLIDVDHFKPFNDSYGHSAGDAALRRVAQVLERNTRRAYDVAARYGGEEFALLLPDHSEIAQVMETIRQHVTELQITHCASPTAPYLTISGGALLVDAPQDQDPRTLLSRVDALLYEAKNQGRNQIVSRQLSTIGQPLPEPALRSPIANDPSFH
jgi:diguanylate cyclase (GGDEF)-like protein